jgi:cold shock CspA family protein
MTEDLSIFLSYSHADKLMTQQIAAELRTRGVRVWIDEGEMRVGDSLIDRISMAIDEVHFVVALVSSTSIESPWCKKELSLAMTGGLKRKGVKVLPLRVGEVSMPPALADMYYLQVDSTNLRQVADQLVSDTKRHQSEQNIAARSTGTASRQRAAKAPSGNRRTPVDRPRGAKTPSGNKGMTIDRAPGTRTTAGNHGTTVDRHGRSHLGRIKSWKSNVGYGFIQREDGGEDLFIHFSELKMKGHKDVTEGQLVAFDITDKGKGPQAGNVIPL